MQKVVMIKLLQIFLGLIVITTIQGLVIYFTYKDVLNMSALGATVGIILFSLVVPSLALICIKNQHAATLMMMLALALVLSVASVLFYKLRK
jgi:hypothetical protein